MAILMDKNAGASRHCARVGTSRICRLGQISILSCIYNINIIEVMKVSRKYYERMNEKLVFTSYRVDIQPEKPRENLESHKIKVQARSLEQDSLSWAESMVFDTENCGCDSNFYYKDSHQEMIGSGKKNIQMFEYVEQRFYYDIYQSGTEFLDSNADSGLCSGKSTKKNLQPLSTQDEDYIFEYCSPLDYFE